MQQFTDDLGRQWSIHLSIMAVKNVAAHVGFDIADLQNNKAVELFSGQTTHLLDILWPLVKGECEKKGISYEAFGEGLRGDSVDAAIAVLREELLAFFPHKKRRLMLVLLAKMEKAMELGERRLEELNPASALAGMESGGSLPTTAPESLESVQTAGLSAS